MIALPLGKRPGSMKVDKKKFNKTCKNSNPCIITVATNMYNLSNPIMLMNKGKLLFRRKINDFLKNFKIVKAQLTQE